MSKLILLFPLLLLSLQNIENGDVLSFQTDDTQITFNKKTYKPFIKNNFFIPIPYKIKQKKYQLITKTKSLYINVIEGNYKTDILKVNKSKTNLNKKQKQKAYQDFIKIKKLYKQYTTKEFKSKFTYPLQSKKTSLYGNKRIFNNTIKSYHSGLDFRAKLNTKIKASNDGTVVLVEDLFYSGKTIMINHGLGLFSIYAHLNKAMVSKNQKIKKNTIIGLSGKSGRVSGPHLHFGIVLNGIKINPESFIRKINLVL